MVNDLKLKQELKEVKDLVQEILNRNMEYQQYDNLCRYR
jgi:hypothetical protein